MKKKKKKVQLPPPSAMYTDEGRMLDPAQMPTYEKAEQPLLDCDLDFHFNEALVEPLELAAPVETSKRTMPESDLFDDPIPAMIELPVEDTVSQAKDESSEIGHSQIVINASLVDTNTTTSNDLKMETPNRGKEADTLQAAPADEETKLSPKKKKKKKKRP